MFEEHGWKKERFCRRFYKKKERKSFSHTWRQDRDKKKRQELDERLYLIDPLDWSKKKNDSMAFLRPYKSILQSELVRSSNNSTTREIPRREEKNFSLQPDSFYSFFSPPIVFIRRESCGCLEIFRYVKRNVDNENCNKGRGKGFISDLRSLRIWEMRRGWRMVSWRNKGWFCWPEYCRKNSLSWNIVQYRSMRTVSS